MIDDLPMHDNWVVKRGDEIAGFAMVIKDASAYRIAALYVVPSYRHRGIGSVLVETVLAAVRSSVAVVVETLPDLHPFYAQFGFEPDRDRPWLLNLKGKGERTV